MFRKDKLGKNLRSPPLDTAPLSDVSVIDEVISDRAVAPDRYAFFHELLQLVIGTINLSATPASKRPKSDLYAEWRV